MDASGVSSGIDSLAIVIEFSVGIAGFSGIAAVLARSPGALRPVERFRLGNLLLSSLLSGFLGFLAIGLTHVVSPENAWRISSAIFAAGALLVLAGTIKILRGLPADDTAAISPALAGFFFSGSGVNLAAQIVHAAGGAGDAGFVVLYSGLVWQLLLAVIQFVRLVFSPQRSIEGLQ